MFKIIICLALFFAGPLLAKVELHHFDTPEQQKAYKNLSEELRCLVCQNQNLADSNAELAQDMRQKTYQLVMENKTEAEIVDYWVTRYGDFVLYDPPFKSSTFILWLGPFFLMLLALYFGKKIILSTKTSTTNSAADISKQNKDHDAVKKLLADNK
jgi:cytochrome c-type biogenesis protein CcmH